MLLKLSIMRWSNAPEFYLLCSNYAPYVSQYVLLENKINKSFVIPFLTASG